MSILQANEITIRIIDKTIIHGLSLSVPEGKVTSIIGPNGCGKSTTLKALARIWPCYKGNVTFNGEEMGRFPHRNWFGRKSMEDDAHVEWALGQTNMLGMQHRLLSTLSGGERQRAWIAMALAQRPQVLLLDEPTTYLDICHQLEVMQLLEKLNRELQLTVVMVIHDINHAVQYSDHIAVIKEGYLVTEGKPQEIVTAQLLKDVFKVEADEFICSNGMPALLPVDLVK